MIWDWSAFSPTPVATQLSVDYLRTQDFAMRPLQWLKLISKNRGTVSVAPPFGYELCQRRVNEKDLAELDLFLLARRWYWRRTHIRRTTPSIR